MVMKTLATLLAACLLGATGAPALCAGGLAEAGPYGPRPLSISAARSFAVGGPWEYAGRYAEGGTTTREASTGDLFLSALLPGLGELRTGHRTMAAIHFAAEAAVWTTFAVFRVQGELRRDDYIEYAEVFAGIRDASDRSDGYFKDLARYARSDPGPDSYNEKEVRDTARALYPDDLEARQRYIEANEITGDKAWNWETVDNWRTYRNLRESSELSFQRSRFCIAAAVANRIASVIGLTRSRGPAGSTIDVGLRPAAGSDYLMTAVSIRMKF